MDKGHDIKLVTIAIIILTAAFIGYLALQPKEVAVQVEAPSPSAAPNFSVPPSASLPSPIHSLPTEQPVTSPAVALPVAPPEATLPAISPSVASSVASPVVVQDLPSVAPIAVLPEGPSHTIMAEDFMFKPQNLTIPVGTTVDWMYGNAKYKHKVHIIANKEAETHGAQSHMLGSTGDHWNYTFNKPGFYEYVDVILPTARGWITVK